MYINKVKCRKQDAYMLVHTHAPNISVCESIPIYQILIPKVYNG